VVGNVSAAKLARTKTAKSVYDASWSSFRDKLRYKAITHGAQFDEVTEAFFSVTCSACHAAQRPQRAERLANKSMAVQGLRWCT
jgi:transposase